MKHLYFILFSFFTSAIYAQTCDGRYNAEIYSNVEVTTVDYGSAVNMAGQTQILQMDIYQAENDTATDRPVVIFCFGGSFIGGSRNSSELVALATALAKRGYVCASIDYRIAASALDLLQEEKMVKVVFGAVQDGKAAIRYFRKNADEGNSLGIDSNQMFIGGTSAGGILAVNLAYLDSLHKLPTTWQSWASQIGGLEGNSGNEGYCSMVSGVFSFAGAVGDTAYINTNDVPLYACHATGDQTVLYNYGAPINGIAPVSLYGSGPLETRLQNLGVYHQVDTYSGADHPPFGGNNLDTTLVHLSDFLYNILDCNPDQMKKSFQQSCADGAEDSTTGIFSNESLTNIWEVYPNPATDKLYFTGEKEITKIDVIDAIGRKATFQTFNNRIVILNTTTWSEGIYFIKIWAENSYQDKTICIKK